MKHLLNFAILLCISSSAISQKNNFKYFSDIENAHLQKLDRIDGKLFALFSSKYSFMAGLDPQICELDDSLNCINNYLLEPDIYYYDFLKIQNSYCFVGVKFPKTLNSDSLIIEHRDLNFNLISSIAINLNASVEQTNTIIDDDSLQIFSTVTDEKSKIYIVKSTVPLNLNFNSINHSIYPTNGHLLLDVISSNNTKNQYIGYFLSGVYQMDKDLNLLSKLDTNLNIGGSGAVIKALDSGYVCFGQTYHKKAYGFKGLGITKMDNDLHYLSGDIWATPTDTLLYPALSSPIVSDQTNYFVTGINDIGLNAFQSTKENTIIIGKYDKDLNSQWIKRYNGIGHFVLEGISVDGKGGGCVYGFVRHAENDFIAIPFIMCFNSDGNITSYVEQRPSVVKAFQLSNNPARDYFILNNVYEKGHCQYHIFDIVGHELQSGKIGISENLINVKSMPPAFYNLVIKDRSGKILQTEKLIKVE